VSARPFATTSIANPFVISSRVEHASQSACDGTLLSPNRFTHRRQRHSGRCAAPVDLFSCSLGSPKLEIQINIF
jgi:hypothetical protein